VNFTGNGVAAVVVAWWEGELDRDKLNAGLSRRIDPSDIETAVTTVEREAMKGQAPTERGGGFRGASHER